MHHEVTTAVASQRQTIGSEHEEVTARSIALITLRRLRRSHTAMMGLTSVLFLLLVAMLADVLAPYGPTHTTPNSMSPPTWQHPMGTDLLERDVCSRIIHGSRVSIYVGVVATVLGTVLGVPLGLGTPPPTPTWGWDLKQNLTLIEINPWSTIFPGLAILVTVLAFNLLGDGLRDALDPRLKA